MLLLKYTTTNLATYSDPRMKKKKNSTQGKYIA